MRWKMCGDGSDARLLKFGNQNSQLKQPHVLYMLATYSTMVNWTVPNLGRVGEVGVDFLQHTVLPTLETGESLTVTTSSGGVILAPMRINYVRLKLPDLIHNPNIVVHGLALPFPHLHHSVTDNAAAAAGKIDRSGLLESDGGSEVFGTNGLSTTTTNNEIEEVSPSPAVVESTNFEIEDRHGL